MTNMKLGRPPTLGEVARAAGVSKGTASNVFNRPEVVRAAVRERVREAARSVGYRGPDPKGRVLSAGKANAIGVATVLPLTHFFEDPYARVLMAGITMACDERGAGVSLVSAAREDELAWNMRSALVDGFVLFCLEGAERLIQFSRERKLPFVALDLATKDETMSVIGIDNQEAGRRAADHLLDLGHRRFAILTMRFAERGMPASHASIETIAATSLSATRDRAAGYFEALSARGISPALVPIHATQSDRATVHAALEAIFALETPPTAILAQSDQIALIALEWFAARGIGVPDAVSIIGFDGVPESGGSTPPLTTMRQPIADIGRRAVGAILDHPGEVWREKVDVELVVRGSTGAPPAD